MLFSKRWPGTTGAIVRHSKKDFILHVKMDYLYIVLSGERLSTAPAAEQLLLIYDFNSKE